MSEIETLTGDALSRAVAEARGWRVKHEPEHERWLMLKPDGKCHFVELRQSSESVVWHNGFQERKLPHFGVDANAAFTLTVPGWQLKVEEWIEVGKPNSWIATYYSNQSARGIGAWGSTPAEAICRAFLALHEREGG